MDLYSTGHIFPSGIELLKDMGNKRSINRSHKSGFSSYRWWLLKCPCGNIWSARASNVKMGKTKRCPRHRGLRHGGFNTSEYNSWKAMKSRCYYSKNIRFDRYGGRGIKVCSRWRHSFANFINDMGKKPGSLYTIDRIDPDGNYTPDNCRWADKYTQTHNRSKQNVTL